MHIFKLTAQRESRLFQVENTDSIIILTYFVSFGGQPTVAYQYDPIKTFLHPEATGIEL